MAVAEKQIALLARVPAKQVNILHPYENLWAFSADVTAQGLSALQDDPDVLVIESVRMLQAQEAQGILLMNGTTYRDTYNGSGMSIAICDTGID